MDPSLSTLGYDIIHFRLNPHDFVFELFFQNASYQLNIIHTYILINLLIPNPYKYYETFYTYPTLMKEEEYYIIILLLLIIIVIMLSFIWTFGDGEEDDEMKSIWKWRWETTWEKAAVMHHHWASGHQYMNAPTTNSN